MSNQTRTLDRTFVLVFAYAVLLPLTKLLTLFSLWPKISAIVINKAISRGLRGYVPISGDVLVCSYFKTGTNWAMYIALQIAHRGRAEFEHIHDVVPWPEMPPGGRFAIDTADRETWHANESGLGVVKVHLPITQIPFVPEARYLCVVRDPKDVFVSSYFFVRDVAFGFLMPSVDAWLDLFLSPHTPLGSWAAHLDSCWRVRSHPNVLFLTYEDMKKDTRAAVSTIAALMGVRLNDEDIDSITALVQINEMKRIGHKFDVPGPPWAPSEGAMIRTGQSGNAGSLISAAQQQRIDAYWHAELQQLGSDFPYEEIYGGRRENAR